MTSRASRSAAAAALVASLVTVALVVPVRATWAAWTVAQPNTGSSLASGSWTYPLRTWGDAALYRQGNDSLTDVQVPTLLGAPPGTDVTFGGSRYRLGASGLTWTQATAAARAAGGKLVEIDSAAENAFILSTFGAGGPVWLGLSDAATEGTFVNSVGQPPSYTNWWPGEPNDFSGSQDYAALSTVDGRWDDTFDSGGVYYNGTTWTTTGNTNITVIEFPALYVSADIGDYGGCAVDDAGSLWCWGYNTHGEAGQGNTSIQRVPVQVSTPVTRWSSVSFGWGNVCGVTTASSLYCWGYGANGQVGDAATTQRTTPTGPVTTLSSTWRAVSVGYSSTCAITAAGALACWGEDTFGKLGNGAAVTTRQTTPQLITVSGVSGWATVSVGWNTVCAIADATSGSGLYCWGYNIYGATGTNNNGTNPSVPTRIGHGAGYGTGQWVDVAVGYDHTCGVKAETTGQSLWCWGHNLHGQLGINKTVAQQHDSPVPTQVGSATTWDTVAAGRDFSCALATSGQLYCWGDRSGYRLGDGANTGNVLSPQAITGITAHEIGSHGDVTAGWLLQ